MNKIYHVRGMNIYVISQESNEEWNMGDATKQAIMVINSSKLVVRRCNILEEIMASMSWVQIVCMNNSHDIAQA